MESTAIMNIYAIYDSVAEEYGPIYEAKNDSVALREIDRLTRQMSPEMRDDYVLVCFGKVVRQSTEMSMEINECRVVHKKEVNEDARK